MPGLRRISRRGGRTCRPLSLAAAHGGAACLVALDERQRDQGGDHRRSRGDEGHRACRRAVLRLRLRHSVRRRQVCVRGVVRHGEARPQRGEAAGARALSRQLQRLFVVGRAVGHPGGRDEGDRHRGDDGRGRGVAGPPDPPRDERLLPRHSGCGLPDAQGRLGGLRRRRRQIQPGFGLEKGLRVRLRIAARVFRAVLLARRLDHPVGRLRRRRNGGRGLRG